MRVVGYYERRALRSTYKLKQKLNLGENEELKAFYTSGFLHARGIKLGDMMFCVDSDEQFFVLPKETNLKYPIDEVLEDEDYLLMIFNTDEEDDVPLDNT